MSFATIGNSPDGAQSQAAHWLARAAANNGAYCEHLARSMGSRTVRWDDAWAADPQGPTIVYKAATLLCPLAPGIRRSRPVTIEQMADDSAAIAAS